MSTSSLLERLQRRIRVARGQEPGDLLLTGGQLINVFTRSIERADVVIADGAIAGVGPFQWTAHERIDVTGKYLMPGLIDGHMHPESTLMAPAEFARVVVPHGTSAVIADPHEVGNVMGVRGIEMLLAAGEGLPLDIFFVAPSCVPCMHWEHAGAVLDAAAVSRLLQHRRVLGLAEMMDFPAILGGDSGALDKVIAASERHAAVDGHAPAVSGRDLVAYVSAGIRSDHESTSVEEALAKARLGMMVQVRDGSTARNLDTLMPLLVEDRLGEWCFCSDDIYPDDLLRDGHIDNLLRRAVAAGVPVVEAVRHASLVPARHYKLDDLGGIAPGYQADIVVIDDLKKIEARYVLHRGQVVARDGEYLVRTPPPAIPAENTVHIKPLAASQFTLRLSSDEAPVIGIIPGQINTLRKRERVNRVDGVWQFDPAQDMALIASIERHRASGQMSVGLVQGLHLRRRAALGSSVAHDSHNLVVAGTSTDDMLACVTALERMGGGFVLSVEGKIVGELPLPVAGLLSTAPGTEIRDRLAGLHAATRELGCPLDSPFATLSFLALSVIPQLRITDQGLFDVDAQQFLSV